MESSLQISAHDVITLCKMTSHALCYADHTPPPRRDPDNPLLWRRVQDGGVRKDTIIVDIRTQEEYPPFDRHVHTCMGSVLVVCVCVCVCV